MILGQFSFQCEFTLVLCCSFVFVCMTPQENVLLKTVIMAVITCDQVCVAMVVAMVQYRAASLSSCTEYPCIYGQSEHENSLSYAILQNIHTR